jgi:hypothetical protein
MDLCYSFVAFTTRRRRIISIARAGTTRALRGDPDFAPRPAGAPALSLLGTRETAHQAQADLIDAQSEGARAAWRRDDGNDLAVSRLRRHVSQVYICRVNSATEKP